MRRADQRVAVFPIDAVSKPPKNHFPTLTVYGNTDHAALRLITCGGQFDFSTQNYEDNIVAFASRLSVPRSLASWSIQILLTRRANGVSKWPLGIGP